MTSTEDRLRFVISLAQTDLTALRTGDWINIRDDLWRFFGWSTEGEAGTDGLSDIASAPTDVGDVGESVSTGARDRIADLQRESIRLLDAWVRSGTGHPSYAVKTGDVRLKFVGESPLMLGGARDLYLLELFALLPKAKGKLLNCACGRMFLKVGKQENCSTKCRAQRYNRWYYENWVKESRSERSTKKRPRSR